MAQQQQQQQQPPQMDPQLPGPTLEELRDYKLGMERATAQFREQVQMTGRQAYIDLIHTLKLTSLKLITDRSVRWKLKFQQIIQPTQFPAKFVPQNAFKPKIQGTYAMCPELTKFEI